MFVFGNFFFLGCAWLQLGIVRMIIKLCNCLVIELKVGVGVCGKYVYSTSATI